MKKYPGLVPKITTDVSEIPGYSSTQNYPVSNIIKSFLALPNSGQSIDVQIRKGTFPKSRFTKKWFFRKNKLSNHFQGIQRLRDGKHFIASIADETEDAAVLVVFKLESQLNKGLNIDGYIGSNRTFEKRSRHDKLLQIIHLNADEPGYWHPGGMGILGDILTVPVENDDAKTSKILFYNVKDPLHPIRYPYCIKRKVKTGAAASIKLQSGKFLCCTWVDSDVSRPYFQFYISKREKFDGKFHTRNAEVVYYEDIEDNRIDDQEFQAIQFIQQVNGEIFILATGNFSDLSPTVKADNYILLLQLTFNKKSNSTYKLQYRAHKIVLEGQDYSNFDAGVGAFVNQKKQLALYSIYHWRDKSKIKLSEYYSLNQSRSKTNRQKDQFVELYDREIFKGYSLNLYGSDVKDVVDYKHILVQKSNFNNKAHSIRFRLAEGKKYELYEHPKYNKKKSGNHLTLLGNGRIQEIKDLNDILLSGLKETKPFGGKISSSRFVQ